MAAITTATSTASVTNALFTKLDTKQKGYIDAADLKSAAGADSTDDSTSAELFKQLDGDADGKITKSELSTAIDKVGAELNAQLEQSRTALSATDAKPGAGAPARAGGGGGGGAAPATSSDSAAAASTKYVAAADTDSDGTLSADEAAAYKQLQANAHAKAQAQVQQYKDNSGASGPTAPSASGSVDVSA